VIGVAALREDILDEICLALGFQPGGFIRRIVGLALRYPAGRFAGLAARFDQRIAEWVQAAAGELLSHFVEGSLSTGPRTSRAQARCW
jgi:hypothetical protein